MGSKETGGFQPVSEKVSEKVSEAASVVSVTESIPKMVSLKPQGVLAEFPASYLSHLSHSVKQLLSELKLHEGVLCRKEANTGYIDYVFPADFPKGTNLVFWKDEFKRPALSLSLITESIRSGKGRKRERKKDSGKEEGEEEGVEEEEKQSTKWMKSVVTFFRRFAKEEFWVLGKNYNGTNAGFETSLDNWGEKFWERFSQLVQGNRVSVGEDTRYVEHCQLATEELDQKMLSAKEKDTTGTVVLEKPFCLVFAT